MYIRNYFLGPTLPVPRSSNSRACEFVFHDLCSPLKPHMKELTCHDLGGMTTILIASHSLNGLTELLQQLFKFLEMQQPQMIFKLVFIVIFNLQYSP
jgi:hypothetical protein